MISRNHRNIYITWNSCRDTHTCDGSKATLLFLPVDGATSWLLRPSSVSPIQDFSNSIKGQRGIGQGMILTFRYFYIAKNNIFQIFKTKIIITCLYIKHEVKKIKTASITTAENEVCIWWLIWGNFLSWGELSKFLV